MNDKSNFDTLFLDIGGVLMTNGWDHVERQKAVEHFGLDEEDFERKHKEFYPQHEKGDITLEDYLRKVVFWKKRDFTFDQFKSFMLTLSKPYPEVLDFFAQLKKERGLKIAILSNEGRDLAEYRIQLARLSTFADFFFLSCFIHFQKPDPHFYQMALDVCQVPKSSVVYIDDRPNLIDAAAQLGIRGILHTNLTSTKQQLINDFSLI